MNELYILEHRTATVRTYAVLLWDTEALHDDKCVRHLELAGRGATGLSLYTYTRTYYVLVLYGIVIIPNNELSSVNTLLEYQVRSTSGRASCPMFQCVVSIL
jgi:hypothetical protein